MRVTVSSEFDISAEQAWGLVTRPDTLQFITKGLIGFRPLDGGFPEFWQEGKTERVRLLLGGLIPASEYHICFTRIDEQARELLTNEAGGAITQWDHLMTIDPLAENRCRYTDSIDIEAGRLTRSVCAYAKFFYRYRQRRWLKLIKLKLR